MSATTRALEVVPLGVRTVVVCSHSGARQAPASGRTTCPGRPRGSAGASRAARPPCSAGLARPRGSRRRDRTSWRPARGSRSCPGARPAPRGRRPPPSPRRPLAPRPTLPRGVGRRLRSRDNHLSTCSAAERLPRGGAVVGKTDATVRQFPFQPGPLSPGLSNHAGVARTSRARHSRIRAPSYDSSRPRFSVTGAAAPVA